MKKYQILQMADHAVGCHKSRRDGRKSTNHPVTNHPGSDEGNFYALDAQSGKPLWDFQTGGSIVANPVSFTDRRTAVHRDRGRSGTVAFRHGDGYVIDLYGLASIEAARHLHDDPAWTAAMVREHDAGLVMIYPSIFGIPDAWDKVGELCLRHPVKGIADPCVTFYSTRPEGTAALRNEFRLFGTTLPPQSVAIAAH